MPKEYKAGILRYLVPVMLLAITGLMLGGDCDALGGAWKFKPVEEFSAEYRSPDYSDFDWGETTVPGQWQRIPGLEKYHGRGVYRYTMTSNLEDLDDSHWHLRFDGVFYKARVFLNGRELGAHEGYFEPFEFEITDLIQERNVLVVEVECLRERRVTAKKQMLGVFGNWDVIANWRNAGGIWRPPRIYATGAAWFSGIKLTTLETKPAVRVRVEAELNGQVPADAFVILHLSPDNFDGDSITVAVPAGRSRSLDTEIDLPGARVWHPYKRGFPHCYRVTASFSSGDGYLDETSFLTGFRTVRVEDGFHFFINDEPMYLKGNNYAPSMVYLSETTAELVQQDVEMMRAAHYDMIRVHAHVDHPALYDACDRGGLLVFQDAPLQWGYDHGVAAEFSRQVKAMVRLLYNHPCIAMWSVHNEPLPAGYDRGHPNIMDLLTSAKTGLFWGKPEWNYLVLDPLLVDAVKEEDASRPVNRGSGMENLDFHQYLGWYGGKVDDFGPWLENTQARDPSKLRFATEFGAQSFPSYKSSLRFMPASLRGIKKEERRLKLDHLWQPSIMRKFTDIADYRDMRSYIAATQDYQARLLKYYIERLRMIKYDPNYGCLAFVHNDSQPAVTWSAVDVWRVPKKAYFTLSDAFRDPYVMTPFRFAAYQSGDEVSFPVYVVNDTLNIWKGCKVTVTLPGGEAKEFSVDLDADMKPLRVGYVSWKAGAPGAYEAVLELSGDGFATVVNSCRLLVE